MLLNLHVKNLALIDEIEVDFMDHLNIMTGETGAGKSIIIGSINAALGGKLSKDAVRDESEEALIELLFQVDSPKIRHMIEENGITMMEDGQLLISRKLVHGRSISRVNGETVTLNQLKELGSCLIDIHGQHEHQSLLHKNYHLRILDRFAGKELTPIKERVQKSYEEVKELKKEWEDATASEEQRLREIHFLEYEQMEIEEAKLKPHEDEDLQQQYKKMSGAREITELLSASYLMTGYDQEGAGDLIGRCIQKMAQAVSMDKDLEPLYNQISEIDNLLNDFNRELSDSMDDFNFDEESLLEVEKRLDLINGLKVKYGNSIEKIQEYYKTILEKLEKLYHYEEYRNNLQRKLEQSEERLRNEARQLSELRKQSAKQLVPKIKHALLELNFLDVEFDMEFKELEEIRSNGMDEAYFVISTNPGEKMRPLDAVASGGELSRIMLAIKSVLAQEDDIETLIFDEIDVGISGRTAQKVSERLAVIAKKHQVICITHLAQIAAMADAHYKIQKNVLDNKTTTNISLLNEKDSILELARTTGGAVITEQVIKSAKEMKQLAKGTNVNRL